MPLSLTFIGRCGDRWRVRVQQSDATTLRGLTLGLVNAEGRPLGPAVVAPAECLSWIADLRGPSELPSDASIRAVMDGEHGETWEQTSPVRTRRGLHAWLHADSRLPLCTRPKTESLNRTETHQLARLFAWLAPCRAARSPCSDSVADMLADFGVDAAEVDAAVLAQLHR